VRKTRARGDYTAIGNVVNLAPRMCGAAEDGQILIDAVAAAEIGDAVGLMSLGTRPLRGFSEPVPVFSIAPQEDAAASADLPLIASRCRASGSSAQTPSRELSGRYGDLRCRPRRGNLMEPAQLTRSLHLPDRAVTPAR
jgi:hypothetical protein